MNLEDLPDVPPPSLKINMTEPNIQGVKQEDRNTVRNVIYLLHACKHPERLCLSWNVSNTRNGYEITGLLDPTKDFEIFKCDLDMISMADPLRVQSISVCKRGDAPQIVIRVLSKSEPVMLTEMELLTVQKKRRLGSV